MLELLHLLLFPKVFIYTPDLSSLLPFPAPRFTSSYYYILSVTHLIGTPTFNIFEKVVSLTTRIMMERKLCITIYSN